MILLNERMKGPGNITQGDLSLLYNHIVTSKVTKVHVLPILFLLSPRVQAHIFLNL